MESSTFNNPGTLQTVGTSSCTTTSAPVVNYAEAAPSVYAEKAKARENKFLSNEISTETKLLASEEKKEAKFAQLSEKHEAKADSLSAKGSFSAWRASRHEEKAMKYRAQATYHQHVAAEAQQSIDRAEVMQSMPAVGVSVPVGTTTQVQTIETPIYSETTRF